MIATGASRGLSSAFSRIGTSFASRRATPNGATSTLQRPFPAGTAGVFAEEMLRRMRPKDAVDPQVAGNEFSAFLKDKASPAANFFTQEQREALFREFLQWQEKKRNSTQR